MHGHTRVFFLSDLMGTMRWEETWVLCQDSWLSRGILVPCPATSSAPTACHPAPARVGLIPCPAPTLRRGRRSGEEAAKISHTYSEGAANCIQSGGFCSLNCVILT